MLEQPPQRLDFDRGAGRLPAYAHRYRFGDLAGPAPLVVYVGGATGRDEYLARRTTLPERVAVELRKAVNAVRLPRLDAIICPCPMGLGPDGFDAFVDHYDQELVASLETAPTALGCIGFSAGGGVGMHLAAVAGARAGAFFGAVGIAERVRELAPVLGQPEHAGFEVALFRNDGDQVPDLASVARAVARGGRLHAVPQPPRRGAHRFRDYAANGTVTAAFRFELERLAP